MYDKIVVLRKTKLDTTEVLISKALIDCYISHYEFLLINNVLRKYNKMKEEIKKCWNFCGIHNIENGNLLQENTAKQKSSAKKNKQNRLIMLLSNCSICGKRKSILIKNQELH